MELVGRYELKFPFVGMKVKEQFFNEAYAELLPDSFGDNAVYRVSSVYFDTSDLKAYWEKLDGEAVRKKFRLRYYSLEGSDKPMTAFMEIKHRIDNRVYKERVQLTPEGAEAILLDAKELKNILRHMMRSEEENRSTLASITQMAQTPGFHAVNAITYVREAWMGDKNDRLRVTFDTSCRALTSSQYLDVNRLHHGVPLLPEDQGVLEIKFNHGMPRWIRDIVTTQQLDLRRFSKYASGVEELGLIE